MSAHDLLDLLRSASRQPLGMIGLITIGITMLARLRADRKEASQRTALWVLLAVGVVALGGTTWKVAPRAAGMEGVRFENGRRVVTIDRSTDYANGLPGGLFDTSRTNHMMRREGAAGMWTMSGGEPYNVGWFIHIPRAGRFALKVKYAARERSVAAVRLGDATLRPALARTTGDSLRAEWFDEGTLELHAGSNPLWFHGDHTLPNIEELRLTELAPI